MAAPGPGARCCCSSAAQRTVPPSPTSGRSQQQTLEALFGSEPLFGSNGMSTYSGLIRRSRLATYNPAIDQIVTATPAQLARSNFGLKRQVPLPRSEAPLLKINALDHQGRTDYRKGTKEVLLVKKWQQLNIGVESGSSRSTYGVQSHYLREGQAGALPHPLEKSTVSAPRVPPFLAMTPPEFERFLDSLQHRRDEFVEFLQTKLDLKRAALQPGDRGRTTGAVSLYAHAQSNPRELRATVEQFLALPRHRSSSIFDPDPSPHPILALQYAPPTALESSFAPPVPGRLLAPSNSGQTQPGAFSRSRNGASTAVSILGQFLSLPTNNSGGASTTTWFPDAGPVPTRSNVPGRASFRLKPKLDFDSLIVTLDRESRRGQKDFSRGDGPGRRTGNPIESPVLAGVSLNLRSEVQVGPSRHVPGSQIYTGHSSAALRNSRSTPLSTSLIAGLSGKFGEPRDLTKQMYTGEQKRARQLRGNGLAQVRTEQGAKLYGEGGRKKQTDKLLEVLGGLFEDPKQ